MNQLANFSGKTVEHERQDSFPDSSEAAVTSFWLMQYIHSGIKSKESQNTPNFFIFCLASQFGGLEIICQLHNIHSGIPEKTRHLVSVSE